MCLVGTKIIDNAYNLISCNGHVGQQGVSFENECRLNTSVIVSFVILKKHLNSFFRPKTKNIFGIHDSVGLRYLFQLRVSLSPLRSHKFCHNFTDTPFEICRCNHGIEDTKHFLFSCPEYAIPRATLEASVINILQKYNLNYVGNNSKLYLYGHPAINSTDNRKILLSTIKYI